MLNPFEYLSQTQINKLFELLKVHIYTYKKNQEIFPTLKSENIVGIMLEGSAKVSSIDYNGNELIIENLEKNSLFDTSFISSNFETYHIIALQPTKFVVIDYDELTKSKNLSHNYFNVFLQNIFDINHEKLKYANQRIRILEKKLIRDRILEYFEFEYNKTRLNYIVLPFSLKELADYLAINRSAMFRELRNLKDEKLITINGKKIKLLYK